jgi:hypothetical protein
MPTVSSAIVAHSMCQPGRPSMPARAGPGRLALPAAPPQQRVEPVALARPVGVAAALGRQRQHGGLVVAGLLAEAGRLGDVVVDVAGAVVEDVGQALVEQRLDVGDDPRDRLHRADVVLGRQHAQRRHVLAEERGLAHAEDDPVLAVALGPLEQRVVDVGDVLHVVHGVPGVPPHRLTRSKAR